MMLQTILESLFLLTTFIYVDDAFWAAPEFPDRRGPDSAWVALVLEYIIQELLGWQLDPKKTEVGYTITLLGMQISMESTASEWTVSVDKATEWLKDITRFLQEDCLLPSDASKLCGRLNFLNTKIYGRLGRVLLRPLIWRQLQAQGPYKITKRLRSSLYWFGKALAGQWIRKVPYVPPQPSSQVIVYSDAESEGYIGLVFIYRGRYWYAQGLIPQSVRKKIKRRRTNIMAYDMIAGVLAVLTLDTFLPEQVWALCRQLGSETVYRQGPLEEARSQ
jgi:hypothetical protein